MKKLIVSTFLLFFAINVYAQNTARITSQYLIQANVLTEMTGFVISNEVENIRREGYNVRFLTPDEWNPNQWVSYMGRLAIRNRRWYRADIGAVSYKFSLKYWKKICGFYMHYTR